MRDYFTRSSRDTLITLLLILMLTSRQTTDGASSEETFRVEPAQTDPTRTGPAQADPIRTRLTQIDPTRTSLTQTEPNPPTLIEQCIEEVKEAERDLVNLLQLGPMEIVKHVLIIITTPPHICRRKSPLARL